MDASTVDDLETRDELLCLTIPVSLGYNVFHCAMCGQDTPEPWNSSELEKKTSCGHCEHRHYRDFKVRGKVDTDDEEGIRSICIIRMMISGLYNEQIA